MLRFEISCWASDAGTGIQSRRRAASLGGSFTRTVYLNSKARDEPEAGASAGPPAARAADAISAVAVMEIPRARMRRILSSGDDDRLAWRPGGPKPGAHRCCCSTATRAAWPA